MGDANYGGAEEPSDVCFFGIGQGAMQATPLQMVNVASAVINGGTLLSSAHRRARFAARDGRTVASLSAARSFGRSPSREESLAASREGMAKVTDPGGTAYGLAIAGLPYSGKTRNRRTGRRQRPEHDLVRRLGAERRTELALAVFVDRSGGYGATRRGADRAGRSSSRISTRSRNRGTSLQVRARASGENCARKGSIEDARSSRRSYRRGSRAARFGKRVRDSGARARARSDRPPRRAHGDRRARFRYARTHQEGGGGRARTRTTRTTRRRAAAVAAHGHREYASRFPPAVASWTPKTSSSRRVPSR